MVACGVAHTIGIEPGNALKRKRRRRLHVHLACDAHPVTQRAEMVRHALHIRLAGRVVPRAAVVQWILAGHQFRAARLAHGLRKVGAIKRQSLPGQAIDVRGIGVLATVQRQIVVRAVICHDDEKIGPLGQGIRRLAKRNKNEKQKNASHGPGSFPPASPRVNSSLIQNRVGGQNCQTIGRN